MPKRSLPEQLEAVAAQLEADAAAIRTTLAILARTTTGHAVAALPSKIAKAIATREATTTVVVHPPTDDAPTDVPAKKRGRPQGSKTKSPIPLAKRSKAERRKHHRRTLSDKMLGLFHTSRPSTPDTIRERLVADGVSVKDAKRAVRAIGPLVRRGYIQKVGPSEYTRTDRAYSVNGTAASV